MPFSVPATPQPTTPQRRRATPSNHLQSPVTLRTQPSPPNPQQVPDELVHINAGGKMYTTMLSTLRAKPSNLSAALVPPANGIAHTQHLQLFIDVDGKRFRHALEFLRSGRLEKGLSVSSVSGVQKIAQTLLFPALYDEAKHIYPLREIKRQARGTPEFISAYLDFADELYVRGFHEEAQLKWDKAGDLLTYQNHLAMRLKIQQQPHHLGAERRALQHLHLAYGASLLWDRGALIDSTKQQCVDFIHRNIVSAIQLRPNDRAMLCAVDLLDAPPSSMNQHQFDLFKLANYQTLTSYHSTDSEGWRLYGLILSDLKDYEAAFVAWDRALELDPTNLSVRYDRLLSLINLCSFDQARRELVTLRLQDDDEEWVSECEELEQLIHQRMRDGRARAEGQLMNPNL